MHIHILDDRLQLFDSTVTSIMLDRNAAWTLTQSLETYVRNAQQQMLRKVLESRRQAEQGPELLEPWVDWIKRMAETRRQQLNLRDWVETHKAAKQQWMERNSALGYIGPTIGRLTVSGESGDLGRDGPK